MQTSIAQVAALTIFGNDVLHGFPREDFWPASTVFTFCKSVSFRTLHGGPSAPSESPFAANPLEWISRLKDAGTVALRLHGVVRNDPRISDRMSAGMVGGGGRWLIETVRPKVSDLWEARWQVGDKDAPDRRIWDVAYFRVDNDRPHVPLQMKSAAALHHDLKVVLSNIEAFAARKNLEGFAKAFRTASGALSSQTPLSGVYHRDLAPTSSIPLETKQLLGAAQAAWVFGGMGSWNDLGFEGQDQKDYEQLSGDLYWLLNQAICTAANSFDPGGPRQ